MATIYDVARHAEVSPATVSRVANGHANVDAALAERVRTAMRELEYRPNAVARNLRRSRTTMWAVMISDIGNPFFTSLLRGVEDVAQGNGYSVVLCNTDEDVAKEERYIDAALTEQVAGVIMSSPGGNQHADRLVHHGVPVVVIDQQLTGAGVDTVLVDNEGGARSATAHLLASGYRRVACITGRADVYTAATRVHGYQQALREHRVPYDEALVRFADFREDGGYEAMSALLSVEPRPDAVFVANNLMTLGALRCIQEASLTVPGELGVVGFDDIPWAHLTHPPLTTIAQPTYELGRSAADLLIQRIASPDRPPTTLTLPTRLQVRASSVRA